MKNIDIFETVVALASKQCGQEEVAFYMSLPQEEHRFSAKHQRNIKRIFRRKRYENICNRIQPFLRRSVATVLIVCTILFASVLGIGAVREDIWNSITDFFSEHFSFGNNDDSDTDNETLFSSPTWLPQGTTVLECAENSNVYAIIFALSDGTLLTYSQYLYGDVVVNYDAEDAVITDISVNGKIGKYITYPSGKKDAVLIWYDDIYAYDLIAPLEKEILLQIAESVK